MAEWEYDAGDDVEGSEDEAGSWVFGGRTGTVFLLDASLDMFQTTEEEEDTPFQKAIKCAHATMMRKIISSDRDLISVVLFNSREMKNLTEFAHVYILQELNPPGAESVLELEKLLKMPAKTFDEKYGHSNAASIADALRICQGIFMNSNSKLAQQSIFLFTNNDDPHRDNVQKQRQAQNKVKDLVEADISLEILQMGEHFDNNKFYKNLIITEDEEDSQYHSTLADPTDRLEELMDRVRRLDHKQRTTGRVAFTLAPGVEMSVGVYTGVRKTYKPPKVQLWKTTNEEVRYMRKEYLEETGELLMPSDYVKYQEFGGKKIRFSLDEVRRLRSVYPPGIEILGFKPIDRIKPYLHVKAADFIYADEKSIQGSNKMFASLLDRCSKRKVVPIVRIIARKNASVAWAALIPQAEEVDEKNSQVKPPGFHACYMPFADDFRNIEMKNLARADGTQVDAAKNFMKKLHFRYNPDSFDNPSIQTYWRNIEALALNRTDLEEIVDSTVPPNSRINRKAGPLLDEFRELVYPASYDPMNPPKKRPAASSGPAAKKPKPDPSSINVEEMAKAGKADKLTVDVLKNWLTVRGCRVTGKKKADLVQDVKDELGV